MTSTDTLADAELRTDAWCGEAAHGPPADDRSWALRRNVPASRQLLAPAPLDLADWSDPRVGWGVVLPERDDVPVEDRAAATDAPEAIRELVHARGDAPVFRWRTDLGEGKLRRYYRDGSSADLSLRGLRGTERHAVPHYLLLCGSPAEIPWSVQYRLQTDAFVGRLDLPPDGLGRYVEALLSDWAGSPRSVSRPVFWAVDHGHPDITWLMRRSIVGRLVAAFEGDAEFQLSGGVCLDDRATGAELATALTSRSPAFVVTSSHGATFPLDDAAVMRGQLGLPLDLDRRLVDAALLGGWNGCGAVWYAHACCSAGSDSTSRFLGVATEESSLGRTLTALTGLGACTAPLPRALLGGANPIAAFIGHVEPTFDWTLRDPSNGQVTTHHIVRALYDRLHMATRPPVGLAMKSYFDAAAGLLQDYSDAIDSLNAHVAGAAERAFRSKLMAFDRLSMVLLGDPTARLPLPS